MAASLVSISPSSLPALHLPPSRRSGNSPGKLGNQRCNDRKLIHWKQPLKTARRSALPVTVSCSTIPRSETLHIVQGIVAKQLSIDETTVTPQTKFSDIVACPGATVELVTALEEAFGVSIGEGAAANLSTVQDAVDLVEKLKTGKFEVHFPSTNEAVDRFFNRDFYPILKKFIVFFFKFLFD